MIAVVVAGDRAQLLDPNAVGRSEWQQLVGYAAGEGGAAATCRANGLGTRDCEITFDAAPSTDYYAILEPSPGAYGWRITYVGVGGA